MDRRYCIIGTEMQDAPTPVTGTLQSDIAAFLNFCRIEKGLAANSLDSYRADLESLCRHVGQGCWPLTSPDGLRDYIDSLYQAGLGSRSVVRRLSTLRN